MNNSSYSCDAIPAEIDKNPQSTYFTIISVWWCQCAPSFPKSCHYNDTTSASWCLNRQLYCLFNSLCRLTNKENINAPHHWQFVLWIHRFPCKGPIMHKAFSMSWYHHFFIAVYFSAVIKHLFLNFSTIDIAMPGLQTNVPFTHYFYISLSLRSGRPSNFVWDWDLPPQQVNGQFCFRPHFPIRRQELRRIL